MSSSEEAGVAEGGGGSDKWLGNILWVELSDGESGTKGEEGTEERH